MADEVIINYIPTNLPTFVYSESIGMLENVSLASASSVDGNIANIAGLLIGQGWQLGTKLYATGTFQISLPIVGGAGPFDTIIFDYFGFTFKIFAIDKGDPDPSIPIIGGNLGIRGVGVMSYWEQNYIIQALADAMTEVANFYINADKITSFTHVGINPITEIDNPLFGVNRQILITAAEDGPVGNGSGGIGNVVGGGVFNGVTTGGGYELISPKTATTTSSIKFKMYRGSTSLFYFNAEFMPGDRGNPLAVLEENRAIMQLRVFLKRSNYTIIAGPSQLIIYPKTYTAYNPTSIDEVLLGVSDYHICVPHVPYDQTSGTLTKTSNNGWGWDIPNIRNPIVYCGFMMSTPRNLLAEHGNFATCVNDFFITNNAGLDSGVIYLVLNSHQRASGPLLTTSGRSVFYSALIGLSEGNSLFNREHNIPYVPTMAQIYAFVPNMVMTTNYATPNTKMTDPTGTKTYICYRSQTTPCEASLWIIIPTVGN